MRWTLIHNHCPHDPDSDPDPLLGTHELLTAILEKANSKAWHRDTHTHTCTHLGGVEADSALQQEQHLGTVGAAFCKLEHIGLVDHTHTQARRLQAGRRQGSGEVAVVGTASDGWSSDQVH